MNTTSGGVLLPIGSAACCSAGILQWFPALSFCYRFLSLSLCLSCSMAAWLMASNTSPHLYAISCLVVCTSSRLSGKWISSPSSINKRRGVSKISPWSPQFVYISFILFRSFYLAPAILRAPSSFLESNILAAGNNRRSLLPCDLEIKLPVCVLKYRGLFSLLFCFSACSFFFLVWYISIYLFHGGTRPPTTKRENRAHRGTKLTIYCSIGEPN